MLWDSLGVSQEGPKEHLRFGRVVEAREQMNGDSGGLQAVSLRCVLQVCMHEGLMVGIWYPPFSVGQAPPISYSRLTTLFRYIG